MPFRTTITASLMALAATVLPATAATFTNTVATGTFGATAVTGTFDYGTTFSSIQTVEFVFSSRELGRNENVQLVLGGQSFFIGTEATIAVTESPTMTRSLTLEQSTLEDLADGSIDFSAFVTLANGATFTPRAKNSSSTLRFEGVEGPAIGATIPLPASLPLALAGLGAFGLLARRRRAA